MHRSRAKHESATVKKRPMRTPTDESGMRTGIPKNNWSTLSLFLRLDHLFRARSCRTGFQSSFNASEQTISHTYRSFCFFSPEDRKKSLSQPSSSSGRYAIKQNIWAKHRKCEKSKRAQRRRDHPSVLPAVLNDELSACWFFFLAGPPINYLLRSKDISPSTGQQPEHILNHTYRQKVHSRLIQRY